MTEKICGKKLGKTALWPNLILSYTIYTYMLQFSNDLSTMVNKKTYTATRVSTLAAAVAAAISASAASALAFASFTNS